MFDVVVVAADNSVTARRAVAVAAELTAMSKGTLHIVTAYGAKTVSDRELPQEFRGLSKDGKIDALLEVLSFIAKKQGVEPVLHAVRDDPAHAIIKTADELKADLVVVGNSGMKGARRVLGSVSNSVAHGANCSVAIIDTTE